MQSRLPAPPAGWGSATLLSLCAEQRPRGLEEERGHWLRGLPALLLPLPGLPPPSPAGNFSSSPLSEGALLCGGTPSGALWPEGGKEAAVASPHQA